jgi:hypothetical protein
MSCSYNQGVVQKDEIAFLKLTGNVENISIQIDNGEILPIISKDNTVYEIKPGVHIIRVRRDSEIIVERKLFFDNQVTREVNVK